MLKVQVDFRDSILFTRTMPDSYGVSMVTHKAKVLDKLIFWIYNKGRLPSGEAMSLHIELCRAASREKYGQPQG